jgi:hypothetical protein
MFANLNKGMMMDKPDIKGFLLLVVVCVLFYLFSPSARAEMEISIGRSQYTLAENGTWWQEGREFHFDNKSNSIGLGFTGYATESIRWHSGYTNLGNTTLWTLATNDADFSGSGCIANPCKQNAVLISKGYVEGLYFTLAPEFKYKDVKFFLEAGIWAYQAHFNVTIIDSDPLNRVVAQYTKNSDIQINGVFGTGVEYKNTQLLVSAWRVDSTGEQIDTQPHYRNYTYNVSIRHMF